MSACGEFFLLDTGSVTPDSIRGRYDGDGASLSVIDPKLIDISDQLSRSLSDLARIGTNGCPGCASNGPQRGLGTIAITAGASLTTRVR